MPHFSGSQRGLFQNIQHNVVVLDGPALLVPVADMKIHLRVRSTLTVDDPLIIQKTLAAQSTVEKLTNRALSKQTLKLFLDRFPTDEIRIPKPPCIAITEIKYIDGDGVEQTWSPVNFQLDNSSEPARLAPAFGQAWPSTRRQMNAVTVEYTAGFGPPRKVPAPLVEVVKLITAHQYENREDSISGTIMSSIPSGAEDRMAPFIIWEK